MLIASHTISWDCSQITEFKAWCWHLLKRLNLVLEHTFVLMSTGVLLSEGFIVIAHTEAHWYGSYPRKRCKFFFENLKTEKHNWSQFWYRHVEILPIKPGRVRKKMWGEKWQHAFCVITQLTALHQRLYTAETLSTLIWMLRPQTEVIT